MNGSAETKWKGLATRLITLVQGCVQRLLAAASERSGRGNSRHMVLLESLSLGNRRHLFLIACDNHRFLVGAGADRVGTVVPMPDSIPDATPLQTASQPAPPERVLTLRRQSDWNRERSMAASGLQLVKRVDGRDVGTTGAIGAIGGMQERSAEAGRTQWS